MAERNNSVSGRSISGSSTGKAGLNAGVGLSSVSSATRSVDHEVSESVAHTAESRSGSGAGASSIKSGLGVSAGSSSAATQASASYSSSSGGSDVKSGLGLSSHSTSTQSSTNQASSVPSSSSGMSASSEMSQAKTSHRDTGATSEQLRSYDVKGEVTRQVTEVSVVDKNGYERVDVTQSEHTSKDGTARAASSAAEFDASFNAITDSETVGGRHTQSKSESSTENSTTMFEGGYQSSSKTTNDTYSHDIDTGETRHIESNSEKISEAREIDGVLHARSFSSSESQTTDMETGDTIRESSKFSENKSSEHVSEGVTHSVSHTKSDYYGENLGTGEVHQRTDEKFVESTTSTSIVDGNVIQTSDVTVHNISADGAGGSSAGTNVESSRRSHDHSDALTHATGDFASSSPDGQSGLSTTSHSASASQTSSHSIAETSGQSAHVDMGGHSTTSHGASASQTSSHSSAETSGHSAHVDRGGRSETSHGVSASQASSHSSAETSGHSAHVDMGGRSETSHGVSASQASSHSSAEIGGRAELKSGESIGSSASHSESGSKAVGHSEGNSTDSSAHQKVADAVEQHLTTHSASESKSDLAAQAKSLATVALDALGEHKGRGADLAQESLDLSSGKVVPTSAMGPHGVTLETLDAVSQRGLSPQGLHELISNLGTEAQGQSNLQLADRVGATAIAEMGENGFPGEKVGAIQEVASGLGAAAGTKDVALTKLEGLELLKELASPGNEGGVLFADAKGGQGLALGVMSQDEFAKSPTAVGAEVSEVKASFDGLASAHDVAPKPGHEGQSQKSAEAGHQAEAQMVMSMA